MWLLSFRFVSRILGVVLVLAGASTAYDAFDTARACEEELAGNPMYGAAEHALHFAYKCAPADAVYPRGHPRSREP